MKKTLNGNPSKNRTDFFMPPWNAGRLPRCKAFLRYPARGAFILILIQ